ncbi:hypothetical protein JCM24511_02324 [Saitozyma sp. JCM 24511]|nr:hypothetical protein JCM24511_02324 [Saitozyma sp. JCM 24511]
MSPGLSGSPRQDDSGRWEEKWAAKQIPWDQGSAHPALVDLLETRSAELGIPSSGRAFVPGCGTGYDVLLFAQRGLDTIGIDLSKTGVAVAQNWLRERSSDDPALAERMRVEEADFFAYAPKEPFDLIYDFTFLCALSPSLRHHWASTITRLSRPSPNTTLITLMFPLDDVASGPPWSLSMEAYHELLDGEWELVHLGEIRPEWGTRIGERRGDMIGVWKRRVR